MRGIIGSKCWETGRGWGQLFTVGLSDESLWRTVSYLGFSRGETLWCKLLKFCTDFNVKIGLKQDKNSGKGFQGLQIWALCWKTVTGTEMKHWVWVRAQWCFDWLHDGTQKRMGRDASGMPPAFWCRCQGEWWCNNKTGGVRSKFRGK